MTTQIWECIRTGMPIIENRRSECGMKKAGLLIDIAMVDAGVGGMAPQVIFELLTADN
jgi:hypothetical protein